MLELGLALTLGLGAGEESGQAEECRVSGALELVVSGCVCVGCGLGRGELAKLRLLIQCLHSSFSSILQQKPSNY